MKIAVPAILSLAFVGIAAAYWTKSSTEERASSTLGAVETRSFDHSAPVEARIVALEQAVSIEREARQLLQEEVLILSDELERLTWDEPGSGIESEAIAATANESEDERRSNSRRRNSSAGPAERLVASGFTPGVADWILRRESELRMEGLQARYDAERERTPVLSADRRQSSENALREELGDAAYERYLEANGRATGIAVSSVLESSPALMAGLQIGDEIVNYDGQRIFSMSDLIQQTMRGVSGQNVIIDITRDGIPMQLVLPRGPLGIMGGRRYGR